jgi:hypothetical protein
MDHLLRLLDMLLRTRLLGGSSRPETYLRECNKEEVVKVAEVRMLEQSRVALGGKEVYICVLRLIYGSKSVVCGLSMHINLEGVGGMEDTKVLAAKAAFLI